MATDEFMRLMAAWALVHEMADEGWKAAVARGGAEGGAPAADDPAQFVDMMSSMIAAEKERLKTALAAGGDGGNASGDVSKSLDALRFELAELRGRIETLQASVDALATER